MANEVAVKQTFSTFLANPVVKAKINEIVGGKDGQRFMTQIISAVSNNPALQECEQASLLNCAFLGESLKLTPSPQLGQYYIVPFKDRKNNRIVATFQLGYKGYIQLAIRSGYYKKINVMAVKENELVNYDPLNEEINVNLIEDDDVRESAKTIGYYAMFEYSNGFKKAMYWSFKKMLAHANKYSQAFSADTYKQILDGKIPPADMWKYSSFWYKDFDGMAYKTMLRQLISKWGIMSIDMQQAFESDMAFEENGKVVYPDNNQFFTDDTENKQIPADVKSKLNEAVGKQKAEVIEPELDYLDILATELKEKHNLTIEQLEKANGVAIVTDKLMAQKILEDSAMLAKFVKKAM